MIGGIRIGTGDKGCGERMQIREQARSRHGSRHGADTGAGMNMEIARRGPVW